jgi:hypothetical protein
MFEQDGRGGEAIFYEAFAQHKNFGEGQPGKRNFQGFGVFVTIKSFGPLPTLP